MSVVWVWVDGTCREVGVRVRVKNVVDLTESIFLYLRYLRFSEDTDFSFLFLSFFC